MFKNSFVVSIKSEEGKFYKEELDAVKVPFNTDYSIYLKNLNSRKAVVRVWIDGRDVLSGSRVIVYPNESLTLEGFLNNNSVEYKFRFIQKTKDVEDHRGSFPEDGIIRIEFDFEKERSQYAWYYPSNPYRITNIGTLEYNPLQSRTISGGSYPQITYTYTSNSNVVSGNSSNGITVNGDDSDQEFYQGYVSELENNPTVITFKLIGTNDKPLYTRDKIECSTCGKTCKTSNKFCSNCGTRILIK